MKRIASLLILVFSLASVSAFACPGDKAKDDGKQQQSTPKKPSTSLSIN